MVLVGLVMVTNQGKNQQRTAQPKGQAGDVDEGIGTIFAQVTQGDGEVILEHNTLFFSFLSQLAKVTLNGKVFPAHEGDGHKIVGWFADVIQ